MIDMVAIKINHSMEIIELANTRIHQLAIVYALINEEDDEAAIEIFDLIRKRVRIKEGKIYTFEGYIKDVEQLISIAKLSKQGQVVAELEELLTYFVAHQETLSDLLEEYRKQSLLDGLKSNYMNN